MPATALATTWKPAIKSVMEETVHIIDDDDSQRAALDSLLRSVDLKTRCYPSVSAFLEARAALTPSKLLWILDVHGCRVARTG